MTVGEEGKEVGGVCWGGVGVCWGGVGDCWGGVGDCWGGGGGSRR